MSLTSLGKKISLYHDLRPVILHCAKYKNLWGKVENRNPREGNWAWEKPDRMREVSCKWRRRGFAEVVKAQGSDSGGTSVDRHETWSRMSSWHQAECESYPIGTAMQCTLRKAGHSFHTRNWNGNWNCISKNSWGKNAVIKYCIIART